jgi:hypothetical protein
VITPYMKHEIITKSLYARRKKKIHKSSYVSFVLQYTLFTCCILAASYLVSLGQAEGIRKLSRPVISTYYNQSINQTVWLLALGSSRT